MIKKSNIKPRDVLRTVLLVIISLIVGITAYSWNAKSLTGDVMPMPFGIGVAVILSGSMEPELSVDDMIIVRKCSEYKVDDVVVFQDTYSFVVHKIIEIDGDTVITKGTANDSPDSPMDVSRIKGKVIRSYPSVGVLITILKSPLVTFGLLGASVLLLVMSYKRERNDDSNQLDVIREEIKRLKEMSEEED